MSEPVYTDFELRKLLNLHKLRNQDVDGGDTKAYRIAKFVRDAVEKKYSEKATVWDADPTLLINVFGDDPGENILAQLTKKDVL